MKITPLVVLGFAAIGGALVTAVLGSSSLAVASVPPAPEWSYLCFDATSASDVNEKANQAAARGWELFQSSPGPRGSIWCLRRPGPSPLREAKE